MTGQHIVFYWYRANMCCKYKICIDVIREHSLTVFALGLASSFDSMG